MAYNQEVMTSYLYLIQNHINGHCYVGVSKGDLHRLAEHRNGLKSNPHLQNAIQLYGIENFSFDCIEEWSSFEEALQAEEEMLAYMRSIGCVMYNMTDGGEHWPKSAAIAGGLATGSKNLATAWKDKREIMLATVRRNGQTTGRIAATTWLKTYAQSEQGRKTSSKNWQTYLRSQQHRDAVAASNRRRCLIGRCGHKSHKARQITP